MPVAKTLKAAVCPTFTVRLVGCCVIAGVLLTVMLTLFVSSSAVTLPRPVHVLATADPPDGLPDAEPGADCARFDRGG